MNGSGPVSDHHRFESHITNTLCPGKFHLDPVHTNPVIPVPGAGVPADQLDFAFHMSGAARWRPTRIYSDGMKTYIQFPSSLSGQEAPVLFVVSGGENRIVNYRMNGTMMVVDYNIDRAILVSGVGRQQQKITIRRGG